MKTSTKLLSACAGLLMASAVAVPAQAVTLEMYSGGASAATPFSTDVPLNLCDPAGGAGFADPNIPRLYINGALHGNAAVSGQSGIITSGKILIWVCKRTVGGTIFDVVIAYSATGSGDGVRKVAQDILQNASKMNFFNHNVPNCTVTNQQRTRASDGKIYLENSDCVGDGALQTIGGVTARTADAKGLNVGWSDVEAAAFHQCGPGIGAANCTAGLPVPAQSDVTAITPFGIVLGNGLVRTLDGINSAGRVTNLSLDDVNSLYSDRISDWRQLSGIGVVLPCGFHTGYFTTNLGQLAAEGRATCALKNTGDTPAAGEPLLTDVAPNRALTAFRRHNSGTKAALDETVMIIADESTSGNPATTLGMNSFNPLGGNLFGTSNQDIRDIVGGNYKAGIDRWAHPNAIGYMEMDQANELATLEPPKDAGDPTFAPGGYIVRLDGFLAYDRSYSPGALSPVGTPAWFTETNKRKNDLLCGRYRYWSGQRFNRRAGTATDQLNSPSTDLETLVLAYLASAQSPSTIGIVPAGEFWVSPNSMNVTKVDTKDPLQWKVLPVPQGCIYNAQTTPAGVDGNNAY
jgi:hypothetical protein